MQDIKNKLKSTGEGKHPLQTTTAPKNSLISVYIVLLISNFPISMSAMLPRHLQATNWCVCRIECTMLSALCAAVYYKFFIDNLEK